MLCGSQARGSTHCLALFARSQAHSSSAGVLPLFDATRVTQTNAHPSFRPPDQGGLSARRWPGANAADINLLITRGSKAGATHVTLRNPFPL